MGTLNLTVKVLNISPKATVADLVTFFSYCGAVDQIQLQRDGEYQQLAFVTFKQPSALQTALLLDDAILLDRRVRLLSLDQSTSVPIEFLVNNKPQNEKSGLIPSPQSVAHAIASKRQEVFDKAKELDERCQGTEAGRLLAQQTKTAISAAESMAGHIGSTIVNSPCFSKGALWLSGVLDKTARYTADLGSSKSRDTDSRKQK